MTWPIQLTWLVHFASSLLTGNSQGTRRYRAAVVEEITTNSGTNSNGTAYYSVNNRNATTRNENAGAQTSNANATTRNRNAGSAQTSGAGGVPNNGGNAGNGNAGAGSTQTSGATTYHNAVNNRIFHRNQSTPHIECLSRRERAEDRSSF